MRRKANWYWILSLSGLVLALISLLFLRKPVSPLAGGICLGVGTGICSAGFAGGLMRRFEESDPALKKQNEIERRDERNNAIRRSAKAAAGTMLQWSLVALFWVYIGLGAPLWVTMPLIGLFLLKALLEAGMQVYYQKRM